MSPRRASILLAAVTAGGCVAKSGGDDSSPECTFEPGVYAATVVNGNSDPTSYGVQSPMVVEIAADGGIAVAVEFVDVRYSLDVTITAEGTTDHTCQSRAEGALQDEACNAVVEVSDWAGAQGAGTVRVTCYVGGGYPDMEGQTGDEATWSVP